MKLDRSRIWSLEDYAAKRAAFRAEVIAHKKVRRIALGPHATLVFEDFTTMKYQVQEMLRVERIVQPDKVQHELDTYNALLPGPGEVAATLFIEITDPSRIQSVLDSLIGLDEAGRLRLTIGGRAYPAIFEPGQSREDRISAVHYIRFAPDAVGREALASGADAAVEVEHGGYRARQILSADTVRELLADLSDSGS
jgi:Protein of unknown function (DUF3501)